MNAPKSATPLCVIANAKAGKGKAGTGLETLLDAHPGSFTVRRVRKGSQLEAAAAQAIEDGFRGIIGAGGDGTISAIANAVAGTDASLGAIPLGTFNYFARRHAMPEDPEQAIETVLAGDSHAADVGVLNGRVFLNNASLGLYPAVLQQRERAYKKWGRSRFLAVFSALRTLRQFRTGLRMKITVDGRVFRLKTPSAFIACNPFQLRSVNLEGAEYVEQGQLVLIAAPDCGRFRLMLNFLRLGMGLAQRGREFEMICGTEILVEISRKYQLVAIDGERVRLKAPFDFRMNRGAITVIAPNGAD